MWLIVHILVDNSKLRIVRSKVFSLSFLSLVNSLRVVERERRVVEGGVSGG
jgi:hypothetical protein